ncbi:MAG: hypothetical protein O3B95_13340, partial [Chloroflexi bacterium]|nr:hypothetical protein [Chloroflexota bacterium]
ESLDLARLPGRLRRNQISYQSERLTERVLESHEEILQDALGMTFESAIDAIHEQLGGRLNHVSSMLSSLPEIKEPLENPADESSSPGPAVNGQQAALPAPTPVAGYLPSEEPVTFKTFAFHIQQGKLEAAGQALSELFKVDQPRGRDCAEVFYGKFRENPEVVMKAVRLRHELTAGNFNNSLSLLWECFGLQGLESVGVVQTLKTQLPSSS